MSCVGSARIAELASLDGHDPALSPQLSPHLGECIACRRELETQRAMRAMLRRMPVPALPNARREELAAELFAIAEREHARPPRSSRIAVGGAVATLLAAAAVVALAWNVRDPDSSAVVERISDEETTLSTRIVAQDDPSPVLAAPHIATNDGAQLVRRVGEERDTLTLIDGTIDVDTRDTRAVDVRVGDSTVRVDDASVRIRARGRAIVSVQVVVGSAHVVAPDRTMTLARDSVWLAEPTVTPVTAFRDAWIAFRAGRHADAIALFDRATDPAVAEEAAYWSAIAAERAGDRTDAARRLRDFLARFPDSAYADQARAALAKH